MRSALFNARSWAESAVETEIALDGGLMSPAKAIQRVIDKIGECEYDDELSAKQQAAALRALNTMAAIRQTANTIS